MASEYVGLGDTVRFGVQTHNVSGILSNADAAPTYFAYRNDSDTITLQGTMTARAGKTGTYRGYIVAAAASGFSAGDYVDIEVSGLVGGTADVVSVKTFVINDVYDANLIQYSGVTITNSDYIANKVWSAQPTDYLINNTFGSGLGKISQDIYFADVKYIKDTTVPEDEISITWFKNNQIISSGQLTNPSVSLYKTSDGSALVSNGVMNYANTSLGVVRYNFTTAASLMASGEPYLVICSGLINSATRSWQRVVGLDSL